MTTTIEPHHIRLPAAHHQPMHAGRVLGVMARSGGMVVGFGIFCDNDGESPRLSQTGADFLA